MIKEEINKLNDELQKEVKIFKEKYKNFDFENSMDLNKKIDFLYDFIFIVSMELNNTTITTSVVLDKISKVL